MRYLQTRILISYLATLVVSLIAFLAISMTVGYRETRKNMGHLLEMQVEGSIRAYEEGGPQKLSQYLQQMDNWFTSIHYLVDAHQLRRALCRRHISPPLCGVPIVGQRAGAGSVLPARAGRHGCAVLVCSD